MTIRRALLLIICGTAVALVAAHILERILLAANLLSASRQALIHQARHVISFVVSRDDWTTFDLPAGHGIVKIETNAISPRGPLEPGEEVRYALLYRFVSDGEEVRSGTYHFRSRRTDFVTDGSGVTGERLFFLESEWVPCDGRVVRLDLRGLGNGRKEISFRIESADPEIDHVLARVFHRRAVPVEEQMFRWERLSKAKRDRLTRFDVYPSELLTEDEQRKYTAFEWGALAPHGVAGRDYDLRVLYKRTEEEAEHRLIDEFIGGLRIDPDRRGVIALSREPEPLLLTIDWVGSTVRADRAAEIILRRYPVDDGPVRERRELLVSAQTRLLEPPGAGWLEIESTVPVAVRCFRGLERPDTEITPVPAYLRGWLVEPGGRLEYRLLHPTSDPLDLRVDLRALIPPAALDAASVSRVRWSFLDEAGSELRSGELDAIGLRSIYDDVTGGDDGERVSDPYRSYFRAPKDADRLAIEGVDGAVLVSLFNRPAGFEAMRESDDDPAEPQDATPLWFMVHPLEMGALQANGRYRAVRWQSRPPSLKDELAWNEYRTTTLYPEGEWLGARVLQSRKVLWKSERALFSDVYSELPAGRELLVTLAAAGARAAISPTLIAAPLDLNAPWSFRLSLDGQTVLEEHGGASPLRFALPALPTGTHRIAVTTTGDVKLLVNFAELDAGTEWLERIALRIPRGPLRFRWTKSDEGDASLGIWLFLPPDAAPAVDACITLRGPDDRDVGPHDTWTFLDRRFVAEVPESAEVIVIGEGIYRPASRITFPLRRDLPCGEWLVEVSFPEPIHGFLTAVVLTRDENAIWRVAEEEKTGE